jgi:hypothetical protein
MIPIARIGDPVAWTSLRGVATKVNRCPLLNFSKLQRFSITKTLLDNKIL